MLTKTLRPVCLVMAWRSEMRLVVKHLFSMQFLSDAGTSRQKKEALWEVAGLLMMATRFAS